MAQVPNYDLEDRLVHFAVSVMQFAEELPKTKSGFQLSGQIIRSSSSTTLNYAEAKSAESRKDFTHKIKVVLKELRETYANLKMIEGMKLSSDPGLVSNLLNEGNELISIFVKSVQTATRNDAIEKEIQVKRRMPKK